MEVEVVEVLRAVSQSGIQNSGLHPTISTGTYRYVDV
jgi:hypothetical protein